MSNRRQQLLDKFARTGTLSAAEDFELCEMRPERPEVSKLNKSAIKQIAKEESQKVKRESEIRRYFKSEVEKAMHEPAERPVLRAARELRRYLRKSATVATPPAKPRDEIIITKSTNIPFVVGTALCKDAQNTPRNLNPASAANPASSESDDQTIPGGARGYQDVGGNLGDEAMARLGDSAAMTRLAASAMKPAVLAVRY